MSAVNSFGSKDTLTVGGTDYEVFRIDTVPGHEKLPFSLKVLLENLLRTEDGANVTKAQIEALGSWVPTAEPDTEIQFTPARVVMQDFTGVPCIVDLATMREAMSALGGDATKINPLAPAELVIDHSVIADLFGTENALERNVEIEYERNGERYQFLRWGQTAFDDFKVVPPGTGIVHQVNIEYLARVTFTRDGRRRRCAPTPTPASAPTRTPRWSTASACSAGASAASRPRPRCSASPCRCSSRKVVGFKLTGAIPTGVTATDVVLTITQMLRKHGVVGKFVEFYGDGRRRGAAREPRHHRQHEPRVRLDRRDVPDRRRHPRLPAPHRPQRRAGRPRRGLLQAAEALARPGRRADVQRVPRARPRDRRAVDRRPEAPAGPRRAEQREDASSSIDLADYTTGTTCRRSTRPSRASFPASDPIGFTAAGRGDGARALAHHVSHAPGDRVAPGQDLDRATARSTPSTTAPSPSPRSPRARTPRTRASCSPPACWPATRNQKGLKAKPWVKTTLAPGSKVVTDYYEKAGLTDDLEALGFYTVGYGCTVCIGNSGPLIDEVSAAINDNDLAVTAVLSGNRNFEGRISPDVKMNYLASPPLVIAYALAGSMNFDFEVDALGQDQDGNDVFLQRHLARRRPRCRRRSTRSISTDMFTHEYASVFEGDERWRSLPTPDSEVFEWDANSTYVRKPPYFDGMTIETSPVTDIAGARVLAKLGDSVTTDHISPAGSIKADSPAGTYLQEHGVDRKDFNSYGSRRGNHEVMIRGTFANIRLRNQLLDNVEGGYTRDFTAGRRPAGVHLRRERELPGRGHAAGDLRRQGVRLGLEPRLGGEGHLLLGVRAVIAESFERIHRSNLIGMGVIPLQFPAGETADEPGARRHRGGLDQRHRGAERRARRRRPCTSSPRRASTRRPARRRSSSTPSCASTPPVRPTTTATAASCSTCSGASSKV